MLSMSKMLSKCLALKLGKGKKKKRILPLVQEGGFQSPMPWNGNSPLLKAFVLQAMEKTTMGNGCLTSGLITSTLCKNAFFFFFSR